MDFLKWIVENESDELDDIRAYIRGSSESWKTVGTSAAGIDLLNGDTTLPTEQRERLVDQLRRAFDLYDADQAVAENAAAGNASTEEAAIEKAAIEQAATEKTTAQRATAEKAAAEKGAAKRAAAGKAVGEKATVDAIVVDHAGAPPQARWVSAVIAVGSIIGVTMVVLLAIAIFAMVLLPARYGGILPQLKDIEIARGLITFVFAFGVMFIAMLLLVALFSSGSPDIGERFDKAKELFTALIAVLGTIMGFYFGAAESQQNTENQAPLEDRVVAGMALLGMPVQGLELAEDQILLIGGVLDTNQTSQEKMTAIGHILEPPTEDSVVAGMARLGMPVKDLRPDEDQILQIDAVLDDEEVPEDGKQRAIKAILDAAAAN